MFGTNATVFVHFIGRDNFPIDYNQKVQSTEHTQYSQQVISKGTTQFRAFISNMRSFIACHIPDRQSRAQIGFDQLSPLALSTRDLVTRLLSPKGYD